MENILLTVQLTHPTKGLDVRFEYIYIYMYILTLQVVLQIPNVRIDITLLLGVPFTHTDPSHLRTGGISGGWQAGDRVRFIAQGGALIDPSRKKLEIFSGWSFLWLPKS